MFLIYFPFYLWSTYGLRMLCKYLISCVCRGGWNIFHSLNNSDEETLKDCGYRRGVQNSKYKFIIAESMLKKTWQSLDSGWKESRCVVVTNVKGITTLYHFPLSCVVCICSSSFGPAVYSQHCTQITQLSWPATLAQLDAQLEALRVYMGMG